MQVEGFVTMPLAAAPDFNVGQPLRLATPPPMPARDYGPEMRVFDSTPPSCCSEAIRMPAEKTYAHVGQSSSLPSASEEFIHHRNLTYSNNYGFPQAPTDTGSFNMHAPIMETVYPPFSGQSDMGSLDLGRDITQFEPLPQAQQGYWQPGYQSHWQ